ncbi:MAG: SDR family oxidoreductase [Desulfatiglandales bacterium]
MRALIIGTEHVIGDILKLYLKEDYEVVDYKTFEFNLLKWDHLVSTIGKINPQVVFFCQHVEDPFKTINPKVELARDTLDGIRNLAQGAARFDAKLVLISSESVFDGKKPYPQPYFEDDRTSPTTSAGQVKLESEIAALENSMDFIIIRAGWVYHPLGEDFVKEILKKALSSQDGIISLPSNRFGSPTLSYRIAMQLKKLLQEDSKGIYHCTSEGYCSVAEAGRFILKTLNLNVEVLEYEETEGSKEIDPGNWILENKNLKTESVNIMPFWTEDLGSFLRRYGERLLSSLKK